MIPVVVADPEMVLGEVLHTLEQVSIEPVAEDLVRRDVGAGQVLVFHLEYPVT